MKRADPFFTIVVPTFNRAQLIDGTLRSVLGQKFANFEVIVVDDGGKDNTADVVAELNNPRICYFKKENGERGAARNFGIAKAKGQYITFLDSDDLLYPAHLEMAYRFLSNHQYVHCYAQAYEIKDAKTGKVLVPATFLPDLTINQKIIQGNLLSCFGVFVHKQALSEIQFEEDRRFAGSEDWLLWLQLAARYSFYYNNEVSGAMLEHESRSVLSFNEESLQFRAEFLKCKLENDTAFVSTFGNGVIKKIYAHMLTYTSLHLAMGKNKSRAMHYWLKAISVDKGELLTRRSLAIAKKLLFV